MDPSNFGGEITINNVTCQQWKIGPTFPKSYWNCIDGPNPSTQELIPANVALSILPATKTLIGQREVDIYVFTEPTQYNKFATDSISDRIPGLTVEEASDQTSVFLTEACTNCIKSTGFNILTEAQFAEVSAHEFGHVIDIQLGVANQSGSPNYEKLVMNDFITLDFVSVGQSEATSIRRDPCNPTPDPFNPGTFFPEEPPFRGVVAETFQPPHPPICEDIDNDGIFELRPSLNFDGFSNSKIAQSSDAERFTKDTQGWTELHAQAFGFLQQGNAADYAAITADKLFELGYFSCAVGEADRFTNGSQTSPAYCNLAIPTWYPQAAFQDIP